MFFLKAILAAAAIAATTVSAHLEMSKDQVFEYKQYMARSADALGSCMYSPEIKDLHARMSADRAKEVQRIRKTRGISVSPISARADKNDQVKQWISLHHEQDLDDPRWRTKNDEYLFNFDSDSPSASIPGACILAPESIYGPYWHDGQPQRSDIRAGQPGIYMRLALQVIDIATCKPMNNAQVDIWQASAAGAYSNEAGDWLRGWQKTGEWGTTGFDTVWPGHYAGRATHVHVAVRENGEKKVLHTGQIYWEEWPRMWIEQTDAYQVNKAPVTLNIDDSYIHDAASAQYDPFAKWAWLGPNYPYDGLISWIVIGVNATAEVQQPRNAKRGFGLFDTKME